MRKINLFFLIVILVFCLFKTNIVLAEILFNNIEVSDFQDRTAKLKWQTSQPTKGDIYYGSEENNLNKYMGFSLYDNFHETILSGLEDGKKYYFRIIATTQSGEQSETYVRNFTVKNMKDTIAPQIINEDILQVTADAVSFVWLTDEKTRADIKYGLSNENLNQKAGYGGYNTEHELSIYNLKRGYEYYFQIIAYDKAGNKDYGRVFHVTLSDVSGKLDYGLQINNVRPQGTKDSLVSTRTAEIKWQTNWVSKGLVTYGTKSNSLNKKVYVSPNKETDHIARLENLEPNTTYYFKIRAYESLYNKSKETEVLSFKTKDVDYRIKTGALVQGSDNKIYIISGTNRYWIQNEKIFNELGFKWSWVQKYSDNILMDYKKISNITNSKKHPDGVLIKYEGKATVYLMDGGKKRPIVSAKAFEKNGYSWNKIIVISKTNASKYNYSTGKNIQ